MELSLEKIEEDPDHPRDVTKAEAENGRLLESMQELGIQQPLVVTETDVPDRYTILDGHRRYRCAKKLALETVPCCVYPKMPEGEFAYRQFEVQNNRKEWTPIERSESFARIKHAMNFGSDRELADFLGKSQPLVSAYLHLLDQHTRFKMLVEKHDLSAAYAMEFVRLKPKLRKIRQLEINDVIEILFEKAKCKVIQNAKGIRRLSSIFLHAHRNEGALHAFLKDPDMTVEELVKQVKERESDILILAHQIAAAIGKKLGNGEQVSSEEKRACMELINVVRRAIASNRSARKS
jgi:ParB/RepB/Spo0J family partition protein